MGRVMLLRVRSRKANELQRDFLKNFTLENVISSATQVLLQSLLKVTARSFD
jgi:uncharacterized protein (DUF1778 family)